MATVDEALTVAWQYQQAGRFGEAEEICHRILAADPDNVAALRLGGEVALHLGHYAIAAENYQRAVRLDPILLDAHCNLGTALQALGRLDEAAVCFQRAIEIEPDFATAHFNLGNLFRLQGQLQKAVDCYQTTLKLDSRFAMAHVNLGLILADTGKLDEAAQHYRTALEVQPDLALAHNGLGTIFLRQNKLTSAVTHLQCAVQSNPAFAEAWNNFGVALTNQEQLDDAKRCFEQALNLDPGLAPAYKNLGNTHKDEGQLDEAFACYRRAVELQPEFVSAYSNLLCALSWHPDADAAAIYEEHRRWNERYAAPLTQAALPLLNDRNASRRLRIGYVSPDFRNHCQSFFTVPLFSRHDQHRFEVVCYSDVECTDAITQRLQTYTRQWREIVGLSDEQVAHLIRQDQIDILIDLTMHMSGGRPFLFARKPAPVQVCWLAYPGTTGLAAMDYRLTDPYLDPPEMFDRYYTEQSVRLPDTFWCYDPLATEPATNDLPASANGHITFGSLNNLGKVNADVLRLWANVMSIVERSRLLLLAPEGSARERTIDILSQAGVAPERISFSSLRPRQLYLELYHRIDIGLDTFPCNGHTTTLDSLWMGVPVVTLVGKSVVGRAGLSQLSNLGLSELVAQTPNEFKAIASRLASDLPRLSNLRAHLRERMEKSPLMDAPRFARNMEAAYRWMWKRWCGDGS